MNPWLMTQQRMLSDIARRREEFFGSAPVRALLLLWVLTMISVPILVWTLGEGVRHYGVVAGVVTQSAVVLSVMWLSWGAARSLGAALGVIVMAWCAEALGTATGWPFGAYHYTELLQPQVLGVPPVIPSAWLMMLPPAWAVAARIVGYERRWLYSLTAAASFTAWDLFLDPQMVAWGLWTWDVQGAYFGIPLVNFLGWFAVSAVITYVLRPRADLQLRPLLVVYTVTWVLQSMGQAMFWSQPGPALAGGIVMGAFVVAAWRSA